MAKRPKYGLLLTSCIISITASALTITSLLTEQWVLSNLILNPQNTDADRIKFGLFSGVLHQNTATRTVFEFTMTCLFDLNVCALLCGPEDYRSENLRKIYYGSELPFVDYSQCALISADRGILFEFYYKHRRNTFIPTNEEKYFINAGVWLSTIIFLIISIIFGVIASALTLWNATDSPKIRIFNIFGVYIFNAVAASCVVIASILWGTIFALSIKHNIPTYQTFIHGFTTDNFASLGFSFYINLLSFMLYLSSIFMLFIRDFILSHNVEILDTETTTWLAQNVQQMQLR